ncbi:MAG: TonB-dependent receptor, partial [Pseudomonadota bacterium]
RDTDENAVQDFDGTAVRAFDTIRPQQIDQFSAELRWHGDYDNVQVVGGLYYFTSDYNINQQTFVFGGEVAGTDYQQAADSYAVFAQVDWEVVDRLTLTLGGRYLYDKKEACGGAGFGTPDNRNFDGFGGVSYGVCNDFRVANGNFSNDILDAEGMVAAQADGSESWDRFTPRIALTYQLDNGIIFASYSQGFRSGGFNGRGTNPSTLGPYDPELVKNYEAGFKSDWFDRRLIFNFTGFYTDYEDKQEDVVFPDPAGATVTVVQNAASATIWGLEAEFRALPMEGLSIGLNIGYLNSEYDEWLDQGPIIEFVEGVPTPVEPAQLGVIDRSDSLLRRAPEWTITADVNYEYQIDADRSLIFAADYSFKDDYSIVANTVTINDPNPGLIDAFGLLNASLSYQTERYKLSVFGRNLTNAAYFQHVLDAATTFGRTADSAAPVPTGGFFTFGTLNPPRTWGIQGEVRF